MKSRIKIFFRIVNPELLIWIAALLYLGFINFNGAIHFTFCPLKNLGFDFCPGCGLGLSIHYLLRLEFVKSFQTHPLGIAGFIILLHRIFVLVKNSIEKYNELYSIQFKGEFL